MAASSCELVAAGQGPLGGRQEQLGAELEKLQRDVRALRRRLTEILGE